MDLLTWRKCSEKQPETKGRYLVCTSSDSDMGVHVSYFSLSIGWATKESKITHWRPIGPLPDGCEDSIKCG